MERRSLIILAGLALAVSGCATPSAYAPMANGESSGYYEERLGEGRYRVAFAGNAHTSRERVEEYLLRRAAELTLQQEQDWFRVLNRRTEGNVRVIQTPNGPVRVSQGPGYRGWRDYGNIYTRTGFGLFGPIWRSLTPSGERLEASAEILLGSGTAPGQEGVFVARDVLKELARD